MSRKKKFVTAATTFSVALGIGFVMQYGDALAFKLGADTPVAGPDSREQTVTAVTNVAASMAAPPVLTQPSAKSITATTASLSLAPEETVAPLDLSVDLPQAEALQTDAAPEIKTPDAAIADACAAALQTEVKPSAMVGLSLSAPCYPLTEVSFHHEGLTFDMMTDSEGNIAVDVPALAQDAYFIAAFPDGEGAVALTNVPDLPIFERVVLQWTGEHAVQLHAREFGANYGEAGHVWSAAAGDPVKVALGTGGFLTSLGDPALPVGGLAEVYTFPTGKSAIHGSILLSVEAEITNRNCGRPVAAHTIQIEPGADPLMADLSLDMPDCSAVGEYLVVRNMVEDFVVTAELSDDR